jgi:copper chaperone
MLRFKVEGMSCGHCVAAVTRALQALDPGAQVEVDLAGGEVRVQTQRDAEQVLQAIREEGYAAEPA